MVVIVEEAADTVVEAEATVVTQAVTKAVTGK
jgi:hypothetical protein